MLRKFHFFLLIGLLSTIFCFTHTFAAEDGDAIDIAEIIAAGDVAFPTADGPAYVQGNAEYQKTPDVVIGDPDFEKMRDLPPDSQDYILWSAREGRFFFYSHCEAILLRWIKEGSLQTKTSSRQRRGISIETVKRKFPHSSGVLCLKIVQTIV